MRSKMGARRRNASSSRKRQRTNQKPLRVYYDKARVLDLLQQYCPEALQVFPSVDSLQTYRAVEVGATNPNPAALLEVGRPWGATASESGEIPKLCVWDRGGYHSDAPDLVPYTYRGQPGESHSERALIEGNGFDATGIFAEFREYSADHRNPKLDDANVIALFQFIMMMRNNRRYYYYGERHRDPPEEHLKELIGAMKVVTHRSRKARSSEDLRSILEAALSSQEPPPAQIAGSPYQSPYQNPYGLGNQQSDQQLSHESKYPSDPNRRQPLCPPPSFLLRDGMQSHMLHSASSGLIVGQPEMKSSKLESSPPSASSRGSKLAPSMDTNRDVSRKSETYSKRMKRLAAQKRAARQAEGAAKQAANTGEHCTNLRSSEDSVLKGDATEQSKKFDLVSREAEDGHRGNNDMAAGSTQAEVEILPPPLDHKNQ